MPLSSQILGDLGGQLECTADLFRRMQVASDHNRRRRTIVDKVGFHKTTWGVRLAAIQFDGLVNAGTY